MSFSLVNNGCLCGCVDVMFCVLLGQMGPEAVVYVYVYNCTIVNIP
jgi:hypothetical protein